jgi:hypothetical protein
LEGETAEHSVLHAPQWLLLLWVSTMPLIPQSVSKADLVVLALPPVAAPPDEMRPPDETAPPAETAPPEVTNPLVPQIEEFPAVQSGGTVPPVEQ